MKCVCVLLPDGFSNRRYPKRSFEVLSWSSLTSSSVISHRLSSSIFTLCPPPVYGTLPSPFLLVQDLVTVSLFGEKQQNKTTRVVFGLFFDFPSHLRCCLVCQKEKCESNKQPVHWTSFCCCCFVIIFYKDTFGSMDCDEFGPSSSSIALLYYKKYVLAARRWWRRKAQEGRDACKRMITFLCSIRSLPIVCLSLSSASVCVCNQRRLLMLGIILVSLNPPYRWICSVVGASFPFIWICQKENFQTLTTARLSFKSSLLFIFLF